MKGMQAIKRGSGFNGLLKYLLSHEKAVEDGRVIGGTMNGYDVKTLTSEFNQVRKLRADIEKPVWHNSLRLPAGEVCSDYKWQEVVEDYMKQMGFDVAKSQYVIVKHDDENAVHIAANRVMKDGSLYLGRNENLASTRIISGLEKTHGLVVTKGLEYDENNRIKPGQAVNAGRKSAKEVQKGHRTGEAVPKDVVKAAIAKVLELGACSAPVFASRLKDAGIGVRANISSAATQSLSGFSFSVEDSGNTIVFKGSQVGYSWKDLQTAGISYDKNADFYALALYSDKPEILALVEQATTVKQEAWDAQAEALDADSYIVHCDRPSSESKLPHLEPSAKAYTAAQVRDAIPRLVTMEDEGYNVGVEPLSSKWTYLRVADTKPHKLAKMEKDGYAPTLVLAVAQSSSETVFRVPKDEAVNEHQGKDLAQEALSSAYGVRVRPKAKMPLAGFKVDGFVSQVVRKATAVCHKALDLFKRLSARANVIAEYDDVPTVPKAPIELPATPKGPSIDEDDFLENHIKNEQEKAAAIAQQGPGRYQQGFAATPEVPTQSSGISRPGKYQSGVGTVDDQAPRSNSHDLSR